MLRSTYKPALLPTTSSELSLPPGWSEHKAPSGHSYYYNATTKQSTYTRPVAPKTPVLPIDFDATAPSFSRFPATSLSGKHVEQHDPGQNGDRNRSGFSGRSYQDRSQRQH